MVTRLRDTDSAERAELFKVAVWFGPACFTMLSMLWYFMQHRGWIPNWLFLVLVLTNIPVTMAGIFALHRAVSIASTGLVKTIFAVGDIAPPRTYPRQEVLIVRGEYAEAADWFRDHLRIEPADHEARLQLAHLLEMRLQTFDEAERLYLEVRNAQPAASAGEQLRATQGLIDLYRKLGRTGRLHVELARFVDRYKGSPITAGAARELRELKEEDPTSESPRSPR